MYNTGFIQRIASAVLKSSRRAREKELLVVAALTRHLVVAALTRHLVVCARLFGESS